MKAHSAAAGGCVAGCGAPRHARDLRRGRSIRRRGPMRGQAKPPRARTPFRTFAQRPHAASPTPAGTTAFRFAGVLEGGAARAAAPRSRPPSSDPLMFRPPAPQIAPLRALPRAPRGPHGSGRLRVSFPDCRAAAKRKPGGFPPGFVLLVVRLIPIRPCGASGAARDRRGPALRSKARGRREH